MKRTLKGLLVIMVSLALTMFLAACSQETGEGEPGGSPPPTEPNGNGQGGQETAKEKVTIGVIVAETGPASALGKPEAEAARLVQKQLAEGLVEDREIEIVIYDNETDDTKAVVDMRKLISEDKAVAVVGGTQTSTSVALREEAIANQIPLMVLAPIDQHGDYIFQIPQSNQAVLSLVIQYLQEEGISKVAWINARDAFGQSGLPIFEPMAAEAGIEIVQVADFDATATDMTVPLTSIRSSNPEALIVWSRPPGAGIVAQNFKQLGFDIPMIQSHAVANQGFLDQVGQQGDGILVLSSKLSVLDQLPDSAQKTILQEFSEQFRDLYNYQPDSFGGYAYDGLHMLIQAIKEGYDTPEAINDYLKNQMGVYLGISGTYDFSERLDGPLPDGMTLLEIAQGSWKYRE